MPVWSSLPLWLPLESFAKLLAPKIWFSSPPSRNWAFCVGGVSKKRLSESRPSCASLQKCGFPHPPAGIGPFAWEGCQKLKLSESRPSWPSSASSWPSWGLLLALLGLLLALLAAPLGPLGLPLGPLGLHVGPLRHKMHARMCIYIYLCLDAVLSTLQPSSPRDACPNVHVPTCQRMPKPKNACPQRATIQKAGRRRCSPVGGGIRRPSSLARR